MAARMATINTAAISSTSGKPAMLWGFFMDFLSCPQVLRLTVTFGGSVIGIGCTGGEPAEPGVMPWPTREGVFSAGFTTVSPLFSFDCRPTMPVWLLLFTKALAAVPLVLVKVPPVRGENT